MDDTSTPNGASLWSRSRDPFKFLLPPKIYLAQLKLKTENFLTLVGHVSVVIGIINCPLSGRGHGHVTSVNFGK